MQGKNKNISDISERISQLIETLGVSVNLFAKKLGYSRSQGVYDMINGKAKPSFDFFHKLLTSEYSEYIDIHYLILGFQLPTTKTATETTSNQFDDTIYKEMLKEKEKEIARLNREIGRLQHAVDHLKKGGTVAGFGVGVRTELDE